MITSLFPCLFTVVVFVEMNITGFKAVGHRVVQRVVKSIGLYDLESIEPGAFVTLTSTLKWLENIHLC